MRLHGTFLGLGLSVAITAVAQAAPINSIWVNHAGGGVVLQQYDLSGNLLDTINAPHGSNGRGIVQVGDILYYTSANTDGVYAYDFVHNTDLGTVFTVTGASGLATMAYDGSHFFIGDYSGTPNVYEYTLTGTPVATIPLHECSIFHVGTTGYCDGLEYAKGNLVSNEYDGGFGGCNTYDVYSLSGTELTHPFINGHNCSGNTGIAFDGTNYYVNNVFASSIDVFDGSGAYVKTISLVGDVGSGEDISVNYAAVLVPEPTSFALLGVALAGLGWVRRKRV